MDGDLEHHLQQNYLRITDEGKIRWHDGSPDHPRNWSASNKAYGMVLIIFLDFFTTAIGTAGIPVSDVALNQLHTSRIVALFAFTSMYLFGQGFGSVVFPPFSESFGRKNLYIGSTFGYAIFCIIIAAAPVLPVIIIGRFLTGLLSSIPTIVVAGSIEDLYDTKARVWITFAWLTVANVGLVVGSIAGSYIVLRVDWQWIFWISGAITGFVSVLLLGIRESRPSRLLKRKVKLLHVLTGNTALRAQDPDHVPDLETFVRNVIVRPLLLFSEPIVLMVSFMSAIAFGLVYLFIEALTIVYGLYGFTSQQSSLTLIALGIGLCFGVFTRLYDIKLLRHRQQARGHLVPEDKLTGFAIASPILALALWWFAWTVPPVVPNGHWIVSVLALIPIGFAVNEFDCVLASYMADSYTIYSASAFASLSMMRSLFSATFPLFTKQLYTRLGPNYASSILAGIATIACVNPFIFLKYGKQIRQRSKFAEFSLKVYDENRLQELPGTEVPILPVH